MFLYPLSSYIASFFHSLGFSFVDSTKLVFGVGYLASIFTMFLWLRLQLGAPSAVVGAFLYGFAPYRFVDLYVRGAIGEHMAFVFPPLILYGLLRLANRKTGILVDILLITFGMAGLVLAHNAISLMFVPLVGLYVLYLAVFQAKQRYQFFLLSSISLGLGLALTTFFWMPAFFEGKYTLRDIVTQGGITNRFVSWHEFFFMPWSFGGSSQLSKELGWIHWAGIFGAFGVFVADKKKIIRWLAGGSLLILLLSLFVMTQQAAILWNNISLLQKFQFPWRILSMTTFLSAFLGAYAMSLFPKKYTTWVVAGVVLALVFTTGNMRIAKGYMLKNDAFWREVYNGTTDTGESSPIWSIRFMEHKPKAAMEVIEGGAEISAVSRTSTKHVYTVSAVTASRILENTLYFPGWVIAVDGRPISVEFQDPEYRGLMTFRIAPGNHTVVVSFEDTKLRLAANIVSLAGVGILIGFLAAVKKYA
jgi:hypothetical protein